MTCRFCSAKNEIFVRFLRMKSSEEDFKYLYWRISKILSWNIFTCKGIHILIWSCGLGCFWWMQEQDRQRGQKHTPNVGLEPTTTRLRVLRSADWANRAVLVWKSVDLFFYTISRKNAKIDLEGHDDFAVGPTQGRYYLGLDFHQKCEHSRSHQSYAGMQVPYILRYLKV